MATLKQRLHRKNSSGSYDVIYLETTADLVKRADGSKSVEASLSEIEAWDPIRYEEISGEPVAPFVSDADTLQGHPASDFQLAGGNTISTQDTDVKPSDLSPGDIRVGANKAWVKATKSVGTDEVDATVKEVMTKDNIIASTEDIGEGAELESGKLYFVYT